MISIIVDIIIYNIGIVIRKVREEKGITQEVMASELDITQSNYGRLEKNDNRLTAPKLLKIAQILNVSVSYLFNEQTSKVINQQHNDAPSAYNVENLYQDNKEIYDKLISSNKDQIMNLKEEIQFLRGQLAPD